MKPHIYLFYGRWCWSTYGKKPAPKDMSLSDLVKLFDLADDHVKRLNRKRGLTP